MNKKKPSAWAIRYATFDFFLFLAKIGLTTRRIPQANISNFVRRHRSQYDKSTSFDYHGDLI